MQQASSRDRHSLRGAPNMDAETVKLIQQTVAERLTGAGAVLALACLIASGAGAFVGPYLKAKGKQLATKEDFNELLNQIRAQTQAAEGIKAEIQRDLDSFSDVLERGREFAGFRRERIAQHLDQVLTAYVDLYSIAQLIPLRSWLGSNTDVETEAKFRASLSRLKAYFGALESLNVLSKEISKAFAEKNVAVLFSWNDVLGEATRRLPDFRRAFPNEPDFSEARYAQHWQTFMTDVEQLGVIIKSLSGAISLPQ